VLRTPSRVSRQGYETQSRTAGCQQEAAEGAGAAYGHDGQKRVEGHDAGRARRCGEEISEACAGREAQDETLGEQDALDLRQEPLPRRVQGAFDDPLHPRR
jgi:hypothetical protein